MKKKHCWSACATILPVIFKYEQDNRDYLQRVFQPGLDKLYKKFLKRTIKKNDLKDNK
jgi:hypothetical protein